MFYGDFTGEKRQTFAESLKSLQGIFKRVFAMDNLITFNRNQTFMKDEAFMNAFTARAQSEQEKTLIWRLHTVVWAARHCQHVPGDFVECGVYKGFSMAVVADALKFDTLDKKMYLYDTFQGIPEQYNSEKRSNSAYEKEPDLYDQVINKFSKYPNVEIVRGIVPDTFSIKCPEKIAFWHIDMNSSASEMAALNAIYDRVSPGGIIVFDDYGWMGYDKQTWAEAAFMKERDHYIMELPTGQGIMIKR